MTNCSFLKCYPQCFTSLHHQNPLGSKETSQRLVHNAFDSVDQGRPLEKLIFGDFQFLTSYLSNRVYFCGYEPRSSSGTNWGPLMFPCYYRINEILSNSRLMVSQFFSLWSPLRAVSYCNHI